MHKESEHVIKYNNLIGKLFKVKIKLFYAFVLMIILGLLNVFVNGNIRPFFICSAYLAAFYTANAFLYSCMMEYISKKSMQLLDLESVSKLSIEECFELLKLDKRVHDEVTSAYKNDIDKECEYGRYLNVRLFHYTKWYSKNFERVCTFCNSSDFEDEMLRKKFEEMQEKYTSELLELFSDDKDFRESVQAGADLIRGKLNPE